MWQAGTGTAAVSHSRCPCLSTGPTGLAGHRDRGWVLALGHLGLPWALTGPWLSALGIDPQMVSPRISGNGNFLGDSQGGETPGETQRIQHWFSWKRLWLMPMTSANPRLHTHVPSPPAVVRRGVPRRAGQPVPSPCSAAACLPVCTASAACWVLVTSAIQGALSCWAG